MGLESGNKANLSEDQVAKQMSSLLVVLRTRTIGDNKFVCLFQGTAAFLSFFLCLLPNLLLISERKSENS